jgi:hypothetical protein
MTEPTTTHPFFKSPFSRQPGTNRRRSTRLDLTIPVVLSGRDARGAAFRDETVTETVNLHGAKVKTGREILVGMQVTVENPLNGALEKGVCVRIYESGPGEIEHFIAVQLIRPGNIWGVENPPEDWSTVAANVLGKAPAAAKQAAPAAAAPAIPIFESQAVTLEQQATTLTEAVLQTFRQQIEALAKAALQDFESRLQLIEAEAARRVEGQVQESLVGATSVVEAMQEDAAAQMAAHAAEAVSTAEQEVRAKVAAILAPLAGPGSSVNPAKPGVTLSRK